jgi:inward rectifier potassium channel
MFRLANKRRSSLIDLQVELNFSYNEDVNGKPVRRFVQLELERKRVSLLSLNWTVVHPLDEKSPLKGVTYEDLVKAEANFAVLLKAFDDTFSQTVHSRTSYQYDEIVWGGKFQPVFERDDQGQMVLDLSKISAHEKVEIKQLLLA